jgi:hypothetical protein
VFRRISKNCEKRLLASSRRYVHLVRLSVRPRRCNNSAPTGQNFIKFDSSISRKPVKKIEVSSKSDTNSVYFIWRPPYIFYNISLISS